MDIKTTKNNATSELFFGVQKKGRSPWFGMTKPNNKLGKKLIEEKEQLESEFPQVIREKDGTILPFSPYFS